MTENKRFVNKGKDIFQYGEWWCSANGEHCADVIATAINELIEENEQLKYNNKMLSMKMSEVYTKYCLLKEFSKDTNPNDAVKRVLSELMQITKEYR